jgi:GNAT superfamily N-acetyltransferase
MRVISYSTPADFLDATAALRDAEPLVTNVISTLAISRADGRLETGEADRWLAVVDGTDAVVGAAVCLPPRALLVSPMSPGAAAVLAAFVAAGPAIPGVDGPLPASEIVARSYAELTGTTATPALDQRMLAATAIRPPTGVIGRHRYATPDDRDLAVAWVTDFSLEAVPDQPPPPASNVERRIGDDATITLWIVDGVPVSLCWESLPAAGIVRVAAVYTPPEHRGHGYAAANVAAVSRRALDRGATTCLLYTDRSNPTSNRLYERIGYTFVADAMEWHLTPAPAART